VSHRELCHDTCSERAACYAQTQAASCGPARPVVGRTAQAGLALWPGYGWPNARCAHGPGSVSAQ
jgi:hypothetical protein